MSNPFSTSPRRLSHVVAFAAFLLMLGTSSAQVTWPTLPPGFKAATNDVTIITYKPLPDWAGRVVDEDNVGLLVESLRAIPDATNAAAVNQRIFYVAVCTNSLKVAEWCLTNGASAGTLEISSVWKATSVQPLGIAIWATNASMVRLLLAAGVNPVPSPRLGNVINGINGTGHQFSRDAEIAFGFLTGLSEPPDYAVIPGPPAALEVAGLLVQGGYDPLAFYNGYAPVIAGAVKRGLWHLTDTLLTNQPVSALRSERGAASLKVALEHGRTNAVNFLRSIPVPEK